MKKASVIGFLLLVTLISCQKEQSLSESESESTAYHVSFTENGVKKSYTAHVLAHADTTSGYITLTIIGANSVTSFDNNIGIYLNNFTGKKPITTGQYEDNATEFTLLTTYVKNAVGYEAGQSVAADAVFTNTTIANHFKVNITSMNTKTIKGTFSGDYFEDGDAKNGVRLVITGGEFYVKFQ